MKEKLIYSDFLIRIFAVVILICFVWSVYNNVSAYSNLYYQNSKANRIINVCQGDTLWTIAAKNAGPKDDIRKLIIAIKQINNLSDDVMIYPGQKLKIPQLYSSD